MHSSRTLPVFATCTCVVRLLMHNPRHRERIGRACNGRVTSCDGHVTCTHDAHLLMQRPRDVQAQSAPARARASAASPFVAAGRAAASRARRCHPFRSRRARRFGGQTGATADFSRQNRRDGACETGAAACARRHRESAAEVCVFAGGTRSRAAAAMERHALLCTNQHPSPAHERGHPYPSHHLRSCSLCSRGGVLSVDRSSASASSTRQLDASKRPPETASPATRPCARTRKAARQLKQGDSRRHGSTS